MGLSYDLISEFVRITNDKKENTKEGTVYATVVNSTGDKYVKIDGSELLTPIDTTTEISDGERVTVTIKDHKATVTGNITSPSVGKTTVDKVVGIVMDENLVGVNAEIENLIAKNAYLENVFAQNSVLIDSKIENLIAKDSQLENAYIENSTTVNSKIENLEATDSRIENSVIENFQVVDGVVQDLKATNADIKILNADFAQIKTLVNGNLTSDNILAFKLTSEKVTVEDAFIKDAMIDTISAGKINAGKINTNSVTIGSEDGGMLITGSTQQFTDKNGNVRIQIGKDASGDFTFVLYGEDGRGQLINQNGITATAIGDGLIVNNMVSDNAAISGGKLDISSVITEINDDTSTTIKSSKIYLNEQNQSLEVAFNSLKTKVDTIQEVTIQGDLTAIVEQVQSNTSKIELNSENISTLISEDTVIKKQVTDLKGTVEKTETTLTSKYTSLNQSLEGFKTTVADTYATKSSVTDVVDNLSTNYSTTSTMNSAINQKAQEISASVSSTYATKNEVKTLDNNLKTNYSTTQQMESAINVAKEEINLGVSSIYETKENVESKVTSTLNSAKSYADTKKSEAITSANNNTSNVIKNYYTKAQTDSQINIAKEAINLGVSTTYETKENVESKVTSTLKSAKSYADTKKTEAINAASTDATTKANNAKSEAITSANNNTSNVIKNYYTKAQTDSQINIAKEAINLGVSTTYETKENVESKVTSTLKSAKSYADTKKTEAINAASTDATTKVNNAKTELNTAIGKKANSADVYTKTEVYTKAQTDSQIKVAKDAINLSVANTYETKTNVESKINGIQVGGRNYFANSNFSETTSRGETTSKHPDLYAVDWGGYNGGVTNPTTSYHAHVDNDTFGYNVIEFNESDGNRNWKAVTQGNLQLRISASGTYTFSVDMFATGSGTQIYGGFYYTQKNGTNASFHSGQFKINGDNVPVNKWKRCSAQCKLGDDVDFSKNISFYIYGMGFSSNKILYIKNVKLEIGNKSTDFTPAPEDTDNSIQDSKKEVIETLNKAVSTLQLNTDSINASVMSLESTMKNNFNGVQNDIQTIQNKVNLAMTSADVKLEIKKEIEKGTNKVATETGFTFDNNGLRIDKSDSEMATRITENGMTITKNNNVVLTANNQGVDAVNLHATTYLIIGGNSRIEDFGSNRTACFWIGNS